MPQDAIVIHEEDNVATALRQLDQGDSVRVEIAEEVLEVRLSQTIPFGHKFALKIIERGEPIIKYGEAIGSARRTIARGEHAHVHNIKRLEARGSRR